MAEEKWEAQCKEDELTNEVFGSVNYYSPDGSFLYSLNLYGHRSFLASLFFNGENAWQPDSSFWIGNSGGSGWAYDATVRFEPGGEHKTSRWNGNDATGLFYLTYGKTSPIWFNKRMFTEDIMKLRIPHNSKSVVYEIPLAGLEDAVIDLIGQCKGKARLHIAAKKTLPKHLKKLL